MHSAVYSPERAEMIASRLVASQEDLALAATLRVSWAVAASQVRCELGVSLA